MYHLAITALSIVLTMAAPQALAIDAAQVPEKKQTTLGLYLLPEEAWDMLQADAEKILFLDVRTRAEVSYVGMPTPADALVPFVEHDPFWAWDEKRDAFRLEPVQEFVDEALRRLAEKGLNKHDKVFVMCRSGTRSAMAANRLASAGFTQVYNLIEGFEGDTSKTGDDKGQRTVNGWKNAGLPWSYALDKARMYFQH